MTTPRERTKAVTDTRELLQMLAAADEITIGGLVQTVAMGLLRHYPLDADLDVSSSALPEVWAAPGPRRAGSTASLMCHESAPGESNAGNVRSRGGEDNQTACGS